MYFCKYVIIKNDDTLIVRYNKGAYLLPIIPSLLLLPTASIWLSIVVSISFIKYIFICLAIIFMSAIVLSTINAVKFQIIIDKDGVLCRKLFTTTYMAWHTISQIGICCSKIFENPSGCYDPPLTSIYFASRCLTEYEKKYFHDKRLPKSVRTIFWREDSSREFDSLLKEVSDYIQKFSSIQIIYFDCDTLKYNL